MRRVLLVYAALTLLAAGGFWLVERHGASLPRPSAPSLVATRGGSLHGGAVAHTLLALAVVIFASRAVGQLFRYLQQPMVMGEVVAGLLLGPSLLGRLAPQATQWLFPQSTVASLGMLSQVGAVLFMFLVGVELDGAQLRRQARATLAIAHAGIAVPFTLGAAMALWLYPSYAGASVRFVPFALFLGVSLSVTAFPVLARILTERSLQRTPLGSLALGCAAVGDVSAWCLLAFVVSVAQAHSGGLWPLLLAALYVLGMLAVVRPLVQRAVRRHEVLRAVPPSSVGWLFVALLLSAACTEAIGVHAVFGAFFLGAFIPHDSELGRAVTSKLEDVVTTLLLPSFFAVTGLRTQLGLLSGAQSWLLCLAVIVAASAGKLGGVAATGRLLGLPWRESLSLGVLMNTRGLMELIVLNIGLDLGVLSPALFAVMVVMALVTTLATAPVLRLLQREEASARDASAAQAP